MSTLAFIGALKEIAEAPFPFLRKWKAETGGRILGYFCSQTPEEMIQAAGFLPFRLQGSSLPAARAARHLQSYSCALVQSNLEAALRGELDFLDGAVFPHTCDSIQRLSDIWSGNLSFPFHWNLVLPVKMHTESVRTYLLHELRRFRGGLEEFIGHPITDDDLRTAFALHNENRTLLREFYRRRSINPGGISPVASWALVKTARVMEKKDHNDRLRALLSAAPGESRSPTGTPIFLAGSVCDPLPIWETLESCAIAIAGDDLCAGWRGYAEDVSLEGEPLAALADRYFRQVPCPCKVNPLMDRGDDLLRRVLASGARGVIFLLLKYCDPHAFDLPYLKEKLAGARIPVLLLEIEPGSLPLGALETRLAAFVEMIGG